MSWLDHQEQHQNAQTTQNQEATKPQLKIHMPNAPEGKYVILGPSQIKRKYKDEIGACLLIILDEVAELLQPSGVKTEAGKQEDAQKQEIHGIIQSITQLGRSAGVHMILCTQRNDASIISGVIQNNPLALDTKLNVLRSEEDN